MRMQKQLLPRFPVTGSLLGGSALLMVTAGVAADDLLLEWRREKSLQTPSHISACDQR